MDVPLEALWTGTMSQAGIWLGALSICLLTFCAIFGQFADHGHQR
jgi:hypothetical protein